MKTFEEATALTRREGAVWGEVPDGWQQGRGAFGGLVLALMAKAMEAQEGDPTRRLRTISAEILAPVPPGPVALPVTLLRRGSSASYFDARLLHGGDVYAHASAMFSSPRKVESVDRTPAAPELERLVGLEPLPVGPPLGPPFAQAFEYCTPGPFPFSGAPVAEHVGTIRLRSPPKQFDTPTLLAYADAWWPAWLNTVDGPRGAATVGFTAQLLVDPASVDPTQTLVHVGKVHAEREGYFVELRELWAGGRLVLLNQQTFAILS